MPSPDYFSSGHGVPDPHRRIARRVPARSVQWALLQAMRYALDPAWTPEGAALRLVEQVPDPRMLRRARSRLRAAMRERSTLHQIRAVAILNLAIHELDGPSTEERGHLG